MHDVCIPDDSGAAIDQLKTAAAKVVELHAKVIQVPYTVVHITVCSYVHDVCKRLEQRTNFTLVKPIKCHISASTISSSLVDSKIINKQSETIAKF